MPHISSTAILSSHSSCSSNDSGRINTPSNSFHFFAILLASFDSVLVGPTPIPTGIPVHLKTVFFIFLQYSSLCSKGIWSKPKKDSSIEYTSISGENIESVSTTLWLMSPYNS